MHEGCISMATGTVKWF
ncbi:cold shock domain protein CspD, partial [Vibrio parahaemolyticus]